MLLDSAVYLPGEDREKIRGFGSKNRKLRGKTAKNRN